jgi:molybdopterin molybdotransferase
MVTVEEALQQLLMAMPALPPGELIPLDHSAGRFLAAEIVSPVALPGFDNSAMDGYAARADDLKEASESRPRSLRLVGRVAAGEVFPGRLGPGSCVRVFTGSHLPAGADCVVMQEDTVVDAAHPGEVLFRDGAKPWENVRFAGEDVASGAVVAAAGARINAGTIGLLAAVGISRVCVRIRPVVGLVATGNELRESRQLLGPGQIFESNRLLLAALVRGCGGEPKIYPLVPDTLADTNAALQRAREECDVVISSGGVSVGELDFVKPAFAESGGALHLWRVLMKPGKPVCFGSWPGKLFFGLPGNPASAMVTFLLFVRPALLRWQGASELDLPVQPGILSEAVANHADRRHFIRVHVDLHGTVRFPGLQGSHSIRSLAGANGLLDLASNTSLPAGSAVKVLRWDL